MVQSFRVSELPGGFSFAKSQFCLLYPWLTLLKPIIWHYKSEFSINNIISTEYSASCHKLLILYFACLSVILTRYVRNTCRVFECFSNMVALILPILKLGCARNGNYCEYVNNTYSVRKTTIVRNCLQKNISSEDTSMFDIPLNTVFWTCECNIYVNCWGMLEIHVKLYYVLRTWFVLITTFKLNVVLKTVCSC